MQRKLVEEAISYVVGKLGKTPEQLGFNGVWVPEILPFRCVTFRSDTVPVSDEELRSMAPYKAEDLGMEAEAWEAG